MRSSAKWKIAALAVVVLSFTMVRGEESHDTAFSAEGVVKASADKLKETIVTPHLEQNMTTGKNVLWCATFQLAWNEVCNLVGEDVGLEGAPAMAAVLNKRTVTKKDVDGASYVALAGTLGDSIYDKVEKALKAKFKGRATPRLARSPAIDRPQDIFAYAYLFKDLEFAVPFEDIADPLLFKDKRVACFGVGMGKKAPQKMLNQVHVLEYDEDRSEFIIELATKSEGDRLILAKVPPEKDLADTISKVSARADAAIPAAMNHSDVLKVPKLNFDVRREYTELYNRRLITKKPDIAKDLMILGAFQDIRFQLDEKGARLRSESHIAFGCSAPPVGRRMVFDGPFLILLKRKDVVNPYSALWVDNAELLVKAE